MLLRQRRRKPWKVRAKERVRTARAVPEASSTSFHRPGEHSNENEDIAETGRLGN
jgi:hypothetical protein